MKLYKVELTTRGREYYYIEAESEEEARKHWSDVEAEDCEVDDYEITSVRVLEGEDWL